jgi:TolA-binding protein
MKRNGMIVAACLLWSALAAWPQTVGAPIEGVVTQEGKPMPNMQIVLTNVDTGRISKLKTDKSGNFSQVGMPYGNYTVDVLNEKGEKIFSQRTSIGTGNTSATNILRIDLVSKTPEDSSSGLPDTLAAAPPKLTKEQLAKIEADNKKIAGLNSLINESQNARQAQDWPKVESTLKQLIAAAPESTRWDFYFFLGEAQVRQNKLQDAVQTYDKGVQMAQQIASGSVPPNEKIQVLTPAAAKVGIGRMLTSQANAYLKLQKPDEAIALLKKASAMEPSSSLAAYNLCGVEFSAMKYDDAKTACNRYLQLEPSGPHAEEVKGFLSQMGSK